MATNPNNIPIPSQEQFSFQSNGDVQHDNETTTVAAVPSPGVVQPTQLDWIMSTIANLESRLTATDRRTFDHRVPPRPIPDPPYALPLPTAGRNAAVFDHQFPFQPPLQSLNQQIPHYQEVIPNNCHQQLPSLTQQPPYLTQQPPNPYMLLPGYANDPFGQPRLHSGYYQQPQHFQQHQGQSYPPLSGPRPTSCWYPSADRPTRGHLPQEHHRGVRMDPPRFDGNDAANWIFKIQYYFDHMMMPDSNRLHYVVPLFDPPASEWIKHYCSNNDFVTWQDFLNEVRYRFDPDCYESYIGLIAKLCQTGSVSDYQLEFERLQNKLSGVPDYILLPIYIAGLKQPLQREVKLHCPSTLAATFALAKELSACRSDQPTSSTSYKRPWFPRDPRNQYTPTTAAPSPAATSTHSVRPSGNRFQGKELGKLPVVRLSSAEKSDRSRIGLCWYCDEKWAPGHVCKQNFLAYMGNDSDDSDETNSDSVLPENNVITADLSHLNTVAGRTKSKSIHLQGTIHNTAVSILVDTGSSHDFLHPRVAEKLSLSLTNIPPFRVYVGNGESLICSHVSKQISIDIQGNKFLIDLHILPFHGPDIILGMEWLESLGRVTQDYSACTMEFYRNDTLVVLHGLSALPRPISA